MAQEADNIPQLSNTVSVKLPIEAELFYELNGHFVTSATKSRACEQFLIARAGATENKATLAAQIVVRAQVLGVTPKQAIAQLLEEKGYERRGLEIDKLAEGLCASYGITGQSGDRPIESLSQLIKRNWDALMGANISCERLKELRDNADARTTDEERHRIALVLGISESQIERLEEEKANVNN